MVQEFASIDLDNRIMSEPNAYVTNPAPKSLDHVTTGRTIRPARRFIEAARQAASRDRGGVVARRFRARLALVAQALPRGFRNRSATRATTPIK
jgi:hypothetical protein